MIATALGAGEAGRQEIHGLFGIPDVGAFLGEAFENRLDYGLVGNDVIAGIAIEGGDRNAPGTLARDHPVGPVCDHVRDSLFAPGWEPLHVLDGVECVLPQIVAIHADEPLVGAAKDGGVVAAPAMRVRVLVIRLLEQGSMGLEDPDDDRVRFPDGLANELIGQDAACAFGVEKLAGGIDRAIGGNAVELRDDEVVHAVTGSGMDSASTGFEGDVVAYDAERIAIEKRVAKDSFVEGRAIESTDDMRLGPVEFFCNGFEQALGNDVDGVIDFIGYIFKAGVETDGHVSRDGPRGGGPDEAVNILASERRVDGLWGA